MLLKRLLKRDRQRTKQRKFTLTCETHDSVIYLNVRQYHKLNPTPSHKKNIFIHCFLSKKTLIRRHFEIINSSRINFCVMQAKTVSTYLKNFEAFIKMTLI